MTRLRLVALLGVTAVVLAVLWFWFTKPTPTDLALYAPADSLLYLESNNPLNVASTIVGTDAWKSLAEGANLPRNLETSSWLNRFVYWTGLGPVENVILVRSQVAVVLTELGTNEEGESLTIKPDGALIIETHTSERRIRQPVESSLQRLADGAYGKPVMSRTNIDGDEFIEWTAAGGSRQLVATIHGSVVIIGNSRAVVQKCLATARSRSPGLKDDRELHARREKAGADALTFGYVPGQNSSKLLSIVVPLLLGRAPGDSDFQRVVTTGTSKLLGNLAWSSRPLKGGIEDRYFISLQPQFVGQLKQTYRPRASEGISKELPQKFYAATSYSFEDLHGTWRGLKTSVSANVDTLSAVLFATLLKTSLMPYGIDDPELFLSQVKAQVLTVRLDEGGERSLLIAYPRDPASLRRTLTTTLGFRPVDAASGMEYFIDRSGEIGVRLSDNVVAFGPRDDVQSYFEASSNIEADTFNPPPNTPSSSSNVITYANDEERVRRFLFTVVAISKTSVRDRTRIDQIISTLPYSSTESALTDEGIERVTWSPLGQFSTLLPLVVPERQIQTVGPPSR